jgi:hypothetical protein
VLPLGVLTTLGAGMGAMFGRPSAVAKRLPVIVAASTPDALP